MIKYHLQLRSVQNVAFGQTALIDCPCGQRYHGIFLQLGYTGGAANTIANAVAKIGQIRVKSNSRTQRLIGANAGLTQNGVLLAGGTVLRDMNLLNGATYDCKGAPNTGDGVTFPIFFNEPWRESPADQDALAWSTAGWLSFQVEVDLQNQKPDGTGADNATVATLKAWAIVDDFVPPANTNPGIVKWIQPQWVPGGTQYDVVTIDRRDWLQQISIYPDTTNARTISQVIFKRSGVTLHELTNLANEAILQQFSMVPQGVSNRTGGIYDTVFDHDGLLSSSIPMDTARDSLLTIIATGGAMAGTQLAVIQRLGPPE